MWNGALVVQPKSAIDVRISTSETLKEPQSPFAKLSSQLNFKMSSCGVDICSCSDDDYGSSNDDDSSKLEDIDEDDESPKTKSHNGTCADAIALARKIQMKSLVE